MTELICVVCALKADADATSGVFQFDESNPLATRACPRCASSATVAVDIFKRFAAARGEQAKTRPAKAIDNSSGTTATSPSPEAQAQRARDVVDKHIASTTASLLRDSHKWQGHVDALRAMLRRSVVLAPADLWWDGYHFYHEHSWTPEAGHISAEQYDYCVVRLINKNGDYRDITFYINLDDEGLTEVGDVRSS